ncbi:MAG: hypothetical protein J6571_09090 [Snodgrassella sp.]|uniref:Uncharacterized protein n=1 Tax=Snodgrassella alvi TaxID=1196083 RepID=A0A2N9XWP7_9NEIS|nr:MULTISPECIES: hypothetical protein [Snodgrassella]MCO6521318.1 hypothetical protein [Snodgrassella sp.]MCO6523325.1 hypothetical protein [Snodgrassella sp.]PIT54202.1 hypothetical protein BHC48_00485 [Snodgrassella communis]SCB85938.1 hypothetical protein GA0061082_102228 [Snodgrassella sp. R-53583]
MKKLAVLFTSLLLALPASSFAGNSNVGIVHPIGDVNLPIAKPIEITSPWLLVESKPILHILYICTWQRATININGTTKIEKQTHLGLGSCIHTMPKN